MKSIRNVMLAVVSFVLSAGVVAGVANASGVDGCPDGYTRKATRTYPATGTYYAASCRLSQCKVPGKTATVNAILNYFPFTPYTVFQYRADYAVAPSNYCRDDVQAASWR